MATLRGATRRRVRLHVRARRTNIRGRLRSACGAHPWRRPAVRASRPPSGEPSADAALLRALDEPRKRVADLLEALAILAKDEPTIRLWLIGPGDPAALLAEAPPAARATGRDASLRYARSRCGLRPGVGHRAPVRPTRRSAWCWSSRSPCGTPIVAADHSGSARSSSPPATGALARPEDPVVARGGLRPGPRAGETARHRRARAAPAAEPLRLGHAVCAAHRGALRGSTLSDRWPACGAPGGSHRHDDHPGEAPGPGDRRPDGRRARRGAAGPADRRPRQHREVRLDQRPRARARCTPAGGSGDEVVRRLAGPPAHASRELGGAAPRGCGGSACAITMSAAPGRAPAAARARRRRRRAGARWCRRTPRPRTHRRGRAGPPRRRRPPSRRCPASAARATASRTVPRPMSSATTVRPGAAASAIATPGLGPHPASSSVPVTPRSSSSTTGPVSGSESSGAAVTSSP